MRLSIGLFAAQPRHPCFGWFGLPAFPKRWSIDSILLRSITCSYKLNNSPAVFPSMAVFSWAEQGACRIISRDSVRLAAVLHSNG